MLFHAAVCWSLCWDEVRQKLVYNWQLHEQAAWRQLADWQLLTSLRPEEQRSGRYRPDARSEEQFSCTQPLSQPMELPSYEEATKQPLASDRMGTKFCRQVFCQKGFVSLCYWTKFLRSVAMLPSPVGTLSAKWLFILLGERKTPQNKIPTSGPLSLCFHHSSWYSYFFCFCYIGLYEYFIQGIIGPDEYSSFLWCKYMWLWNVCFSSWNY